MSETLSHAKFISEVTFNSDGLVPVIAQRHQTGEVLMFAWMNRETLQQTLTTGHVTYWSRSRKKVWRKGEESGHTQRLVEAWIDCDGDCLLMKVDQIGAACHTGAPSCFFRQTRIEEKP
ncbi:MAG TPA: phosphoribosyl-AMP cyclohydrolase [Rhizomicrobium sp.]|jgi:phosphoribosyl-AMP cyclohydrolase|nr:phosphoribosyl-AMP cyclohydrolase [Rhizomicrobium sp.]